MPFSVYFVRCLSLDMPRQLAHPGVVKHSPAVHEIVKGRNGVRQPNGYAQSRVVVDGPPPAASPGILWSPVGQSFTAGSPTYVPLEGCKRGHAPLRYLSNGGCVYCARRPAAAGSVRLKVQVPETQAGAFPSLAAALGWHVDEGAKLRCGRLCAVITAPGASRAGAVELIRSMGWEAVLF